MPKTNGNVYIFIQIGYTEWINCPFHARSNIILFNILFCYQDILDSSAIFAWCDTRLNSRLLWSFMCEKNIFAMSVLICPWFPTDAHWCCSFLFLRSNMIKWIFLNTFQIGCILFTEYVCSSLEKIENNFFWIFKSISLPINNLHKLLFFWS